MRPRVTLLAALLLLAVLVAVLGFGMAGRGPDHPRDIAVPGPVPLPDRTLRITTFGTSLTAGGTWPDDLARALSACIARPVAVQRVARPGANSSWGLEALPEVTATTPDIVLVEFATNDADLQDGLALSVSRANHETLFAGLAERMPQARIVGLSMNPARGLRGLMRPRLGGFYAAAREAARASGAGFIDLYPRWGSPDRTVLPDGLHPTAIGASSVIVPPAARAIAASYGQTCPEDVFSPPPASSG